MSETQEELDLPVPDDAVEDSEESFEPIPFDDDTEILDTPEEDWAEEDVVDPEEAAKARG